MWANAIEVFAGSGDVVVASYALTRDVQMLRRILVSPLPALDRYLGIIDEPNKRGCNGPS